MFDSLDLPRSGRAADRRTLPARFVTRLTGVDTAAGVILGRRLHPPIRIVTRQAVLPASHSMGDAFGAADRLGRSRGCWGRLGRWGRLRRRTGRLRRRTGRLRRCRGCYERFRRGHRCCWRSHRRFLQRGLVALYAHVGLEAACDCRDTGCTLPAAWQIRQSVRWPIGCGMALGTPLPGDLGGALSSRTLGASSPADSMRVMASAVAAEAAVVFAAGVLHGVALRAGVSN